LAVDIRIVFGKVLQYSSEASIHSVNCTSAYTLFQASSQDSAKFNIHVNASL